MRYCAASYYPRYSDPLGTFVALDTEYAAERRAHSAAVAVECAADRAAEFEQNELPSYCEEQCGDCSLCCPDIIGGMAFSFRAKDLFTVAELKEHRRALMRGEVVCLSR